MSDKLNIQHINITELNPAPYNPRKWSSHSTEQLTESIKRFGLVDPIIVNGATERENIVIGGHFRLKVAKDLGFTEVPVVYVDIPDEAREKELNLRLNRNTGEWDFELLKQFDIDLLLDVGFDDSDLGDIWNDALETDDDDFDVEKAIKEAASTTIKLGDMFQLGKHRLICGSSTDSATIKRLVGELTPTIFYSDPPYNIGLDYNKGVGLKAGYGGTTNDSKSDAEYASFLSDILKAALPVLADNAHVFMYCDQTYIGLLQTLMAEHGLKNRRVCLWIKNGFNVVPQVAFNKGYEPCIYATRGNPYLSDSSQNLTEILNKDIASGNRTIDDIVDLFDIWLAKREAGQDYEHPTQKPINLHEKPLKRCSKVGDIVLDVFGGSGSTLIACEQMMRVALLSEIEPVFCQVIIDRWEAQTDQKAVKL
ncbi:MAG TPA: DNA modification methylase [Candidatus Saccharimonadales bacterium]|nr:DNA modification methylase [Candidatus Saccharimonadales bacterium]